MIFMPTVTNPKSNYTYTDVYADVVAVTLIKGSEGAQVTVNFYATEELAEGQEPLFQGQIGMPSSDTSLFTAAEVFMKALSGEVANDAEEPDLGGEHGEVSVQ